MALVAVRLGEPVVVTYVEMAKGRFRFCKSRFCKAVMERFV